VCPIRQSHLDLLGVPLLVKISRSDIREWGLIDDVPFLAPAVLESFLGSFDVIPAHDCFQEGRKPQKKTLEAAPRWRLDNPA